MMATLRAEFRKLLTVRSTYIITILIVVVMLLVSFYVEGWRLGPQALQDPSQLSSDVFGALTLSVFGAVIAILLMTHEYRYNTIIYTLTGSNSRSKVLLSKIIVISAYALFLTAVLGVLSPLVSDLGVHAHGHTLVSQIFHVGNLTWRSLFYGWSYGMIGLLLAVLIRIQVGAIVALFVIPTAIEGLLSELLKHSAIYLPFAAQAQVIGNQGFSAGTPLSPGRAATVVLAYLIIGWIVAWVLFLKRDAN
jgi:ABC-2 type transport system permease protein